MRMARGAKSLDVLGVLDSNEELRRELVRNGLGALAARLGTSERTLRRRFDEAGVRPADYVRSLRRELLEALLAWGATPEEMAEAVGFHSGAAVHRFIRREFGMQVRRVRKSLTPRRSSYRPTTPSQPLE